MNIQAAIDGKPVRLKVDYAALGGPFYAAHIVMAALNKGVTITIHSFDYRLSEGATTSALLIEDAGLLGRKVSPTSVRRGEVRPHHVGIETRLPAPVCRHLDKAVLDVGAVQRQHLVHPAALAGDGLAGHVVADRRRPLARGLGERPGCRCCGSPSAGRTSGHVGDAFGLEEARRCCADRDAGCRTPG